MINKNHFLSDIYGFNCYDILFDKGMINNLKSNFLFTKILDKPSFLSCKIPSNESASISNLVSLGFVEIGNNVIFEKDIKYSITKKNLNVFKVKSEHKAAIQRIVEINKIPTRFHLDKAISYKSSEIIGEWVLNFFEGKRGDSMFIVKNKGSIAGFMSLIFSSNSAIIDLICIDKKYHRKGLATELINSIKLNYSNIEKISVGTYRSNHAAISLYNKSNFTLSKEYKVFHLVNNV